MASAVVARAPLVSSQRAFAAQQANAGPFVRVQRCSPRLSLRSQATGGAKRAITVECRSSEKQTDATVADDAVVRNDSVLMAAASLTPLLLLAEPALAKDGEFGLLEGRSAALVHPLVMGIFFLLTVYAGFLGYQWRRTRELAAQIAELKKSVPAPAADGTVAASPAAAEIEKLTEERAALLKGNVRDKHFVAGSILLAGGVGIAVEGCVNTFMRTGRLFPGPHLYAGALITVLWAAAAALVPAMQKGNEAARNAHIALNVANLLLFVSQIPTGLEIVGKVFEFTTWP